MGWFIVFCITLTATLVISSLADIAADRRQDRDKAEKDVAYESYWRGVEDERERIITILATKRNGRESVLRRELAARAFDPGKRRSS
jgi:hypothetical protein